MSVRSKVAELLALRDSVSESAVSLDKFADEDAVRVNLNLSQLCSPSQTHISQQSASQKKMWTTPSSSSKSDVLGPSPNFSTPTRRERRGTNVYSMLTDIPEHVLRPSASVNNMGPLRTRGSAQSFNSRLDSARSQTQLISPSALDGTRDIIQGNGIKKPSPSPSIKRSKAERLLKEHGSPPGLRVTAGGRIVPTDMVALGSPQYPLNSAKPTNMSNSSLRQSALEQSNGQPFVGTPFADHFTYDALGRPIGLSGQPVFSVPPTALYSQMFPYPPGTIHHVVLPNGQVVYPHPPQGQPKQYVPIPPVSPVSPTPTEANSASLNNHLRITNFKKQLERLHLEQRDLERDLVIRESQITPEERTRLIGRKMEMINQADEIRKEVKQLQALVKADSSESIQSETQKQQPSVTQTMPIYTQPLGFAPGQVGPQSFPYQFPQQSGEYPSFAPQVNQISAFYPGMQPLGGTLAPGPAPAHQGNGTASGGSQVSQAPSADQSNESPVLKKTPAISSRRSHALEIKDPRKVAVAEKEKPSNFKRSTLDPTSPTYEPKKSTTPEVDSQFVFVPPSPSPIASPKRSAGFKAHFPWLCDTKSSQDATDVGQPDRTPQHKTSASSINTEDFFPTNPHEHSTTSFVNRALKSGVRVQAPYMKASTHDTPEKKPSWDLIPWNPQVVSPSNTEEGDDLLRAPQVSPISGTATCSESKESQKIDYSDKSSSFLEGLCAGLTGGSINADMDPDFMLGYSTGLLRKRGGSSNNITKTVSRSRQPSLQSQRPSEMATIDAPLQVHAQTQTTKRQSSLQHVLNHLKSVTVDSTPTFPTEYGLRPIAPQFNSFDSNLSITSGMGIPPIDAALRSITTDKALRPVHNGGFDAFQAQYPAPISKPMMHFSGNQQEERKSVYRADKSPPKLSKASPTKQVSTQTQQKAAEPQRPMRSFTLSCMGEQGRGPSHSFDGAMDDLSEMIEPISASSKPESSTNRSSPSKFTEAHDASAVSTGSPKKVSRTSPTKAKFEEMANKVMKSKKTDREDPAAPASMSRDDKKKWREEWKRRFIDMKQRDQSMVDKYRHDNPLP
ncbi:uncharacterized protein K452DRAFT_342558 [Aplosporella prunicola CBS 121167]|uniref:Uncharacterized protein n=1 Tax=Aplosporella prunicola CBS 121167 TaxID=1176127 RepID=A0A6A6BNU2_9PEZI|nr:uncharacterized protein K452DRAFT_342558 [Aplosporella prunicola CBS 121167]KAF2145809.1 hypothetical protein K452DRAFT_342558 [Aplosporella prunicola CBS 121167]